ncbi:(2Fe-2S)-binding protein [Haloactinospora alba]|uniref:(2Fe-2S)-binding protein n=1 Tax=Haloactinospora alba TaxID=405555 RepID=UPI001FED2846|nr:(2Fe-2S)-binding protein [Haloactinospora alba]
MRPFPENVGREVRTAVAGSGVRAAVSDVSAVNAFFSVDMRETGSGWLPLRELWEHPGYLEERVSEVRTRLASRAGVAVSRVERRVAASIMYQGLASRLLSPTVGAALCHGVALDPGALRWRPEGGMLPLALVGEPPASDTFHTPRVDSLAELIHQRVVQGTLAPIATALRSQVKVAPRLLWGNAASSLAGTVQALARDRPWVTDDAVVLTELLLGREPFTGLGEFDRSGEQHAFVRATCCLYYRIPGCGMCGDCALLRR